MSYPYQQQQQPQGYQQPLPAPQQQQYGAQAYGQQQQQQYMQPQPAPAQYGGGGYQAPAPYYPPQGGAYPQQQQASAPPQPPPPQQNFYSPPPPALAPINTQQLQPSQYQYPSQQLSPHTPQNGYNNIFPAAQHQGDYAPSTWGPNQAYGAPSLAPQFAVPAPAQPQTIAATNQYGPPPAAQNPSQQLQSPQSYNHPAVYLPSQAPQQQPGGGMTVVPRTYLGATLHPFWNPLLPPQEQGPEHAIIDDYNGQVQVPQDVETIRRATKGLGCDSRTVMSVVMPMSVVRLPPLTYAYRARFGVDLAQLLEKELRGNVQLLVSSRIRGPLFGDVSFIDKATVGLGTNESLLTELVIGRYPSALALLRAAYARKTHRDFDTQVLGELSFKTKAAFQIALVGEWRDQPGLGKAVLESGGPAPGGFNGAQGAYGLQLPVNEHMVQQDVELLSQTLRVTGGTPDAIGVANVLFARSPSHLNRLQQAYLASRRAPLTRHIKSNYSGHLKSAFLFALEGAKRDTTGAWRDAKMIHKTMEGIGTRDNLLIIRLLRAHWNPTHLKTVKDAYMAKYRQPLATRVMKETSGDYREALLNLINAVP